MKLQQLCQQASESNDSNKRKGFKRASKIICTIGPKSSSFDVIDGLMQNGMNTVRLNFSHGEYDWFRSVVATVNQVKQHRKRADVSIALDTKGPEIRTGRLANGSMAGNAAFTLPIVRGEQLLLTHEPSLESSGSKEAGIYVDYSQLGRTLQPGSIVFIDDGLLKLQVTRCVDAGSVQCVALNSAALGERKGINLPGAVVDLPAISDKDRRDLHFGIELGVDFVFASFVRRREHVQLLRHELGERGRHIGIISKIENLEGLQNFDDILAVSDGIMVARGDLGIEIAPEKVFSAQKMMIAKCNLLGKPVICATQMLESMVVNPRPTRAEVSDVANAILDGADAVMLSGETAKGAWPHEAVDTMARVVREAEAAIDTETLLNFQQLAMPRPAPSCEAVAAAAVRTCNDQMAQMLVVITETGEAPALAAKYRPGVPILAVTASAHIARRCSLLRGVVPMLIDPNANGELIDTDELLRLAIARSKQLAICGSDAMPKKLVALYDTNVSDGAEMTHGVMRIMDYE
jgi:pyruvate kinase